MTPSPRASRLLFPAILGIAAFTLIGVAAVGSGSQPNLVGAISANQASVSPTGVAASASEDTTAAARAESAAPSPSPLPVTAAKPSPTPPDLTAHRAVTLPEPIAPADLTGYEWPLIRGRTTLPFGPSPWGSRIVAGELFHDGMDLATFCGDRVVAAHDGVVLAAGRRFDEEIGWIGDLGPYFRRLDAKKLWPTLPIVVITDDGNGYRSVYAHFGKVVVKAGQKVKAGQLIGYEGRTGHASGCHLHFGLFSPLETASFAIDPDVVERMKVPAAEVARIDPLLVLPYRPEPTAHPSGSPAAPD